MTKAKGTRAQRNWAGLYQYVCPAGLHVGLLGVGVPVVVWVIHSTPATWVPQLRAKLGRVPRQAPVVARHL